MTADELLTEAADMLIDYKNASYTDECEMDRFACTAREKRRQRIMDWQNNYHRLRSEQENSLAVEIARKFTA